MTDDVIIGANEYFSTRMWTTEWDNADDTLKTKAVETAKNQIDAIDMSQYFSSIEYPKAIYEQALFLLKLTPEDQERLKLQDQGVRNISVKSNFSETYQVNGLPVCSFVRELIRKYQLKPGQLI